MAHLPFSVFRRSGRRFFYVQFKDSGGKYLPAISTKQTTEEAAVEIAFKWLREGKPAGGGGNIGIPLHEIIRNVKTASEADFICREFKRRGLLKTYTITGSRQDTEFAAFLKEFWNFDISPYIKERLRKNHGIHRYYCRSMYLDVEKYWRPFFEKRLLGSIERQDIELFINTVGEYSCSAKRKNNIIRVGTIALKWAFAKELIDKDITYNITWFSGAAAERQILSPEIARAVFLVEWEDNRSRLANMLAAVTGLRAGEIQGLKVQDLGKECLYIRHSWNCRDGLKTTKNNGVREVEVSFPSLINELLNLAANNPHGANMDSYVFWAEKSPSKPMESCLFLEGLRDALVKTGMSKESAAVYSFHGWRHFFTSYMINKLERKLLKSQTGHLTDAMLTYYGDHKTEGDRERIRQAQTDVFGALVPGHLIGRAAT